MQDTEAAAPCEVRGRGAALGIQRSRAAGCRVPTAAGPSTVWRTGTDGSDGVTTTQAMNRMENDDRPTVLVTGSGGRIGYRVCERLAGNGYFVVGFDRAGWPEPPKGSDFHHVRDVEADLTDYTNVRFAVQDIAEQRGTKLASVVHLAAYYDFSGADSPLYEKVTVEGTDRLLNALQDFEVEQFLFSSTMLVHKPCKPGERIAEDDPLQAKWPYPQSKIDTEKIIVEGHPGVRSVLLRIGGVFDEWCGQPTLGQQIKRIHERDLQSHVFPGDAQTGQSMVHLEDTVDAIVRTVDRRADIPPHTPILIGEPDPLTYAQLQDRLGQLIHGSDWTTVRIPQVVARAGAAVLNKVTSDAFIKPFMIALADDHYALDVSRAKELLDWQPQRTLPEILPKMVENLKADPAEFYERNGLGTPPQ